MKRVTLLFTLILVLIGLPAYASEDSLTFIGGNLGLAYLTGASDNTLIKSSGFIGALTAKHFFNKRFGVGGTFFSEHHLDKEDAIGNWESTISGGTIDFMLASDSPSEKSLGYLILSFGSGTETAKEANTGLSIEYESSLWGFGLGYLDYSRGYGIGGEVRYLSATDSSNADGILQAYLSLGFVF
jgi:hypothetical protein